VPFFSHIKRLYASEFIKFSAVLLSSNAISQVIGIVAYPVITRLYAPELFGEFNLFLSIAGILILLTTGRYELAIVLPESEKKATALFHLSLLLTVCISFLFFILIQLFDKSIISFFHQEQLALLLPYLPVYLLLWGVWRTLNNFFIRQKKYYSLSAYNISQSVAGMGIKCFFGLKGFFSLGLLWGQLLGQFLAVTVSVVLGRSSFKRLKPWDKQEIIAVAKTYSNFPKFQLPQGLLNGFSDYLPVLLLSFYFEPGKIGLFSLVLTIGFALMLFAGSIYQTMFRKISEQIQNQKKIMNDCLLFVKMCLIAMLPFFILIMFMPDRFFTILLGLKWTGFGFYLKCMLPWLFLEMMNISLLFIPNLFFRQKTAMIIEIIYVASRIIALLSGAYFRNFDLAIGLFSAVSALITAIKLIWYFRLVKKYDATLQL